MLYNSKKYQNFNMLVQYQKLYQNQNPIHDIVHHCTFNIKDIFTFSKKI